MAHAGFVRDIYILMVLLKSELSCLVNPPCDKAYSDV